MPNALSDVDDIMLLNGKGYAEMLLKMLVGRCVWLGLLCIIKLHVFC